VVSEKDFFRLVARVAGPTLQDEQRQLPVVGCQFSEEQAPKGFVGSKGLFTRLKPGAPIVKTVVSGGSSVVREKEMQVPRLGRRATSLGMTDQEFVAGLKKLREDSFSLSRKKLRG